MAGSIDMPKTNKKETTGTGDRNGQCIFLAGIAYIMMSTMILIKKILITAILICTLPLLCQVNRGKVQFKEGVVFSKIKVSIFDNVIYIPVSVNGHPPMDFVLDTGAPELSIIEKNLIPKMKIPTRKGGHLRGAGSKSVRFVLLENVKLSLPDVEVTDMIIGSHTLSHMEPYWGKPKYGMLGGNILKHLVTEIDYIGKYVTFYRPDHYGYSGKGEKIPIKFITNAILIKATINPTAEDGGFPGLFLIDTAVRNSFFNSPFVRNHRILKKGKKTIENITGFGIGGEGFGKLARIKTIRIGRYRIDNPVVELTTDTRGIAASKEFDGIIGADILSRFKVVFDYTRGDMILEANGNFNQPFQYDMSGLYLIADHGNLGLYKVAHVVKGSPAERAGILKGDLLLQIDGRPVALYNYEQVKNFFKQEGKTVHLKILRNTMSLKKTIQLKKLL